MTIRAGRAEPCWQVNDATTGQPPQADGGEGWPHFKSEAFALADLDDQIQEWLRDYGDEPVSEVPQLVAAQSFDRPCAVLICDRCGQEWEDGDIGWSHHDPVGSLEIDLEDYDWVEVDGKHYCSGCGCPPDQEPEVPDRPIVVSADQIRIPW